MHTIFLLQVMSIIIIIRLIQVPYGEGCVMLPGYILQLIINILIS